MLKMAVPLMGTLHQKWHKQMGKMMVHLWIEGYFLLTQISFWMIGMATHKPRMDDWYFVLTQISFDFPSRLNRYGGFFEPNTAQDSFSARKTMDPNVDFCSMTTLRP
jgi:hypothetical protein